MVTTSGSKNLVFVVRGVSTSNVPFVVGRYPTFEKAKRAAKTTWRISGICPRIFRGDKELQF